MRKNDERDRSFDRLLRRRLEPDASLPAPGLPAPGLPATDACVDAETLAAWMDGSLSREALDRAEHHAAGCARCQAMLASMARTAPDTAGHPWWRSLTARWVVPIASAATALALWVSVDRQQNPAVAPVPPPAELSRTSEPAAPPTMLADAQERPAARPAQDKEDKDAPARSAKAETPADTRAAQKPVPGPVLGGTGDRRTIDALRPSLQTRSDHAASVASTAAATAAPAPPPPPAAPPVPNAAPGPPVISPLAETVTVISESSAKATRAVGGARESTAFTAAIEIVSPEPGFRWRLSAPATIQRSTDRGVTWQLQVAPAGIVLTAGSSPARDVCWIVGRAGAVMLSTDGTTWQLRPFTEPVNLTAVRAIDAKKATVTTADGRQFSTADGGATWSKLPL